MQDESRRRFLIGCGVITFTSSGVFFAGCGVDKKDKIIEENKTIKKDIVDVATDDSMLGEKLPIKNDGRELLLSKDEFNMINNTKYIYKDNMVIFMKDNHVYGFSKTCPHEGGSLEFVNDELKCKRHTIQRFDKEGKSNNTKTRKNLILEKMYISLS
jgi:nitrite reductase/ring-hydroxylating ferredoxin subunit